jgi:DNA-binding XRE family transcriptional regulator
MAKTRKAPAVEKPVVRRYSFPSLAAYFQHQRDTYTGPAASPWNKTDRSRDTLERFANRMGVSEITIARITSGTFDPSFKLAIRISREADCPVDGMGKSGVI